MPGIESAGSAGHDVHAQEPVTVSVNWERVLGRTSELAQEHLVNAPERAVAQQVSQEQLVGALGGPLGDEGLDPVETVRWLADAAGPGLVLTNAGRYFGFVEGGVLPAALAADWLASTWDQNASFFALSPAAAAAEEVCRRWLCDLLTLPEDASMGLTTGAQMANLIGLAAARHQVLADAGWDLAADGLFGAPQISVLVGRERHATIDRALRFLGFGRASIVEIPGDAQGRMDTRSLASVLGEDGTGPAIVCAQAGNVNTGACDPLREICRIAHDGGAWVHVDGAFGLWAAAAPSLRHLVNGVELADSWATDGHKWLNVPYDCGIAFCAHPDAHRAAMSLSASYLARGGGRAGSDWTPQSSRRARAFPVWAALASLGRSGVAGLVENSCARARQFADLLAADEEITVLNDVVLNQVLVRIGDDVRTRQVAEAVQAGGATWLGTTVRAGITALRISISDHATGPDEVTAAADDVIRAVHKR